MIWILIFFILYSIASSVLAYNFWRKIPEDQVLNIFYEIHSKTEYDLGIIYKYWGVIKTLYPNGVEKTLWKSKHLYYDKKKCENETKLRYKFLCEYYGKKYNENQQ